MAYTKYSLTPANNTAAPPDGAPEGMLPSAVNDTMRDMMAQIRDVGDGIRDGTYTMTAPKITGGTITGATFTGNTFSNPIITGVSTFAAGTVSAPAITTTGDTNTGIFFPAADTIAFTEGGVEAARFDASGRLLIGTTSGTRKLTVYENAAQVDISIVSSTTGVAVIQMGDTAADNQGQIIYRNNGDSMEFGVNGAERMRITSGGSLLVGKTARAFGTAGIDLQGNGADCHWTASGSSLVAFNRLSNDGTLVEFAQDGTVEGNISVSGSTVSYNGGHLSRYAQTITAKDDSLLKGTVLSNLDEMNEYVDAEGNPVDNEQLNKVKVSDVEGDVNVAGVFVNWSHDEQHNVDEINMAMTGDMIIRIAEGVVVQKGDLLMSAGNGTAKPQGDDIVRSKTIAKVTSNHVTCTYADGSYCVPCVLMAC